MAITIVVAGQTFLEDNINIGDKLNVTNVTNPSKPLTGILLVDLSGNALVYEEILVTEVIGQTSIAFEAYLNSTSLNIAAPNLNLASTESFTFDIVHPMSKDEQAAHIASIAQSYNSHRVVLVWPPEAVWDEAGTTTVDGSVIAAITAAAMASYPAQQSFTNLPFPGPYQLHYSNEYFSPAQLNVMSNAGVFVLVQDTPGAQVYCRHQKTTSNVSIQMQEFSITKAVDKLSLDLWTLVKPYIGKYNITQDLLTAISEVISQYLYSAQSVKSPFCGALIVSSSGLSVRANIGGQNTDLPVATIAISLTIEVGYPANYIPITLYVQ